MSIITVKGNLYKFLINNNIESLKDLEFITKDRFYHKEKVFNPVGFSNEYKRELYSILSLIKEV